MDRRYIRMYCIWIDVVLGVLYMDRCCIGVYCIWTDVILGCNVYG